MGRYRAHARRNYVMPLTRFVKRSPLAFPRSVSRALRKANVQYKYTTECPVCQQDTFFVFDTGDGEYTVCGNPECEIYADLQWSPKRGGR